MAENKPIRMYTISTCSHCKAAKRFLDKCTVRYDFTDVDLLSGDERRSVLEDLRKINPNCSVPTIIIDGKIIIGFDEKAIVEALGL